MSETKQDKPQPGIISKLTCLGGPITLVLPEPKKPKATKPKKRR